MIKKSIFAIFTACALSLFPLFADEPQDELQTNAQIQKNESSYLQKLNIDELELSRIFTVDLRKDENFLKAIEASINFYSSILAADQRFFYGEESYTPLQMLNSLAMFKEMAAIERPYEEFLLELKEKFDLYAPTNLYEGSKLTGYYTPEIRARASKNGSFRYPLYLTKQTLKAKKPDFFVQEEADVKRLTMEGAGILALEDGKTVTIQYAGKKRAIDEIIKKRVKITLKKGAKQKRVFVKVKQTPKPKSVFFITPTKALGSLSTELVAGFSAAMDMSLTPMGSLIYVKAEDANKTESVAQESEIKKGFESFMLVQDIGGAIKGPGRVDIYCGEGEAAKSCTYEVTTKKGAVYMLIAKKGALEVGGHESQKERSYNE